MNTLALTTVTNNYIPSKNLSPFFDITRAPMSAMVDGAYKTVARDALFSPTGELMGVVSPKYKVTTNKEVVDTFDEFFSGYKIDSVKDMVSGNGAKWRRDYIIEDDRFIVEIGHGKSDILKTKVTVFNGYDGKSSVGMNLSAYRMICKNGMMGWKNLIGSKFSHFTKNILNILKAEVEGGFNKMQGNFQTWEEWTKIPFNETQFKGFINSRDYLSDKQKEATNGLYRPIMGEFNEEETAWGAYNVVTAIATHHTSSRNDNVANEFSSGYKLMEKVAKDFFGYKKAL